MRISMFAIATMLVPAVLCAQQTLAKPGRIAGIAPAPAAPQALATQPLVPPPGQFLYGSVPVIVAPDGRVYADFGYGYEAITRGCDAQPNEPAPSWAGVTQPVVTQPLVVQPRVASVPLTPVSPSPSMPRSACWTTDGRGQFVVRR
jgi:hypothetical protein